MRVKYTYTLINSYYLYSLISKLLFQKTDQNKTNCFETNLMRKLQTMSKTISKNLLGKQTKYDKVELNFFSLWLTNLYINKRVISNFENEKIRNR